LMVLSKGVQAQTIGTQWRYIRADNTGLGGDYHEIVRGDRFGNLWTGGYLPFWSQGSLVRFDGTTFTNWGTYAYNYLPDDRISNIAFDNNDRIWVGTQNGLATSADGINWQHHTSLNSALQWDEIHGIAIEANNNVWVVTGEWGQGLSGGVGYYNGTNWTFYTSSNSGLPTQQLSDIAVDQNNNKWIASNLGLIKYDGLNWILYTSTNSGLSQGGVREVMIDSLNRVWACNGPNVDIFDGSTWSHINNNNWPINNFSATSMYIRGNKMIFAETTNSSRVQFFDGTTWHTHSTGFLNSCYIDVNGVAWIAGNGEVSSFDGIVWKKYTRFNTGLSENFNEDIFIDSKNRKWIANGNGGVHVYECPNWEIYGPWNEGRFPSPQNMSTIGTSACEAPNGDIWFTYDGSNGYAVKVPGGNYQNYSAWEFFDKTNSHPWFQEPLEVESTDSGQVFFRTFWTNTYMYNYANNTWSLFDLSNGITSTPSCLAGKDGKMYIGHFEGIDVYENGVWSHLNFPLLGLPITHVYDIKFDQVGNMWLGTVEGLWKYDGVTWTNWNESNSNIAANNVWAVEIDTVNNLIYVGAHETMNFPYYGGISYFNGAGNVFTTYLEGTSPISHKQVEDLAVDTLGNIWILTQSEGFNVHNPNGILGFDCIDHTLQIGGGPTSIPTLISTQIELMVSPNPATEKVIVTEMDSNKPLAIDVFSIHGNLMGSYFSKDGKCIINVSSDYYNNGIYIVKNRINGKSAKLSILK
jgi:Two component regulator propeller